MAGRTRGLSKDSCPFLVTERTCRAYKAVGLGSCSNGGSVGADRTGELSCILRTNRTVMTNRAV